MRSNVADADSVSVENAAATLVKSPMFGSTSVAILLPTPPSASVRRFWFSAWSFVASPVRDSSNEIP